MSNLDGMKLPKVNPKIQKSKAMAAKLSLAFHRAIQKVEHENDYEFFQFEINAVFADALNYSHQRRIKDHFSD